MADWEALFAQASDIPAASSKRANAVDDSEDRNDYHNDGTNKSRKKQRTSRNSHVGSSDSSSNRGAYQRMLKSRLDPPPGPTTPWFSWMAIEESFLDGNAVQSKKPQEEELSTSSGNQKIRPKSEQQSPLSFRLALSKEQQHSQHESWHLKLFCHGRNLRCCAKLLAQLHTRPSDDTTRNEKSTHRDRSSEQRKERQRKQKEHKKRLRQRQQHQKSLFRNMQNEANGITGMTQSILGFLPNDEANLLVAKASEASGLVKKLISQRNRERKRSKHDDDDDASEATNLPSWSWEPCIRIIMACDALYYRLYYQQLTGLIPVDTRHEATDDEMWHIPHPQFYFGLEGLTMQSTAERNNNNDSKSSKLMQSAQELKDSSPELEDLMDHLVGQEGDAATNHALESIHRHRLEETMSLFQDSGWPSSPKTLAQWKSAVFNTHVNKESKHETPAPQLLMDWRDSSRDFLCHLYAYATVSSKVLQQVAHLLAKLQQDESIDLSKGIVEVGAGTGYLAELLRGQGMPVEAWDIQPTTSGSSMIGENRGGMNEYHGHVPPFSDVQKASTFPSTSDAKRSALLLCYPPPESPMALNTLSAYRKAGGRCLIHIGEFKGLTGDYNFEKALLKKDMQCIARHPCLGWGTDAAYVTVWITKGTGKVKSVPSYPSVLLPCSASNCSKESIWRCRPLRQLVYCSKECYHEHKPTRNCLFSLFNVHTDPSLTRFGSKAFEFAPLV